MMQMVVAHDVLTDQYWDFPSGLVFATLCFLQRAQVRPLVGELGFCTP